MGRWSRWQWALCGYGIVVAMLALLWLRTVPQLLATPSQIDFRSYYDAALALRTGQAIYPAPTPGVIPFLYPPLVAVVWLPLTWVAYPTAATCWYLLNLCAWGTLVVLVGHLFPMPTLPKRLLIATLIVLPAMSDTVLLGQITHIITLAMLLVWHRLVHQQAGVAGVVAGVVMTIKVQLSGLFFLFLVQKQWRASLIALATMLLVVAAGAWWWGWALTATWIDMVRIKAAASETHPVNQSLWAGVTRIFQPTIIQTGGIAPTTVAPLWAQPVLAYWVLGILVGGVVLGTVWWCWRHPADALTDLVCAIPVMLWCAPVSWESYSAHLVIPMAWLWQRAHTPAQLWRLTLAIALLLLQRLWRVMVGVWPSPLVLLMGVLATGVVWWSVLTERSARGMMEHTNTHTTHEE